MAEIDPVILELRADLGRYRAELKSTTSNVTRLLGQQEGSAKRLETQMRKSSLGISSSILAISAALGAAFSGRQLSSILDSFTRMQNSLSVAGLEGEALKATQDRLFASAQKFGVELEGLAGLYSTTSQAAKGFGASQEQVFAVTDSVSAALKITGQSSQQAAGALLQLGQAFRSPKVQAEEFNSLIDGMYPLLEAAASASDRWRGDVSKLIADVKKGTVTGQEFFRAVAAGSEMLQNRATKATLTLAAGFTTLSNAVTVYFGEADKAAGVSAAMGFALKKLAENLDTIIPALAVIATVLAGRFLAGALVGGTALKTLAAYASIATTSLAGTALAARSAGAALLAAFGGPVGLAITALVIAIGVASQEVDKLAGVTDHLRRTHDQVSASAEKSRSVIDRLASAYGNARKEALALAEAQRKLLIADAVKANSEQLAARKNLTDARARANGGRGAPTGWNREIQAAYKDAQAADANAQAAWNNLRKLERAMAAPPIAPTVSAASDDKKKKGRTGASGPDPKDAIFRAQQDELNAQLELVRAKSQNALEAGERGNLERDALNIEAQIRDNEITEALRKKDITAEQAKGQREILDQLYGKVELADEETGIAVRAKGSLYGIAVARDERRQAEQDAADIAEAESRAASDALRDQYDLALTLEERRRIALDIIDLEDRSRLEALRRIQLDEDIYDAKTRQLAAIEEARILGSRGAREEMVRRANQGPLDRYIESMADPKTRTEEAMVRQLQSVNDGITDALTKQLGIKNQFVKDLFSIFLDDVIFRPLAEAMRNRQSGGGGGILGSIIGAVGSIFGGSKLPGTAGGMDLRGFGRASGGYVAPGQTVRVNEHRGGAEYLRMGSQGGTVIPLGQVNQMARQPASQGGGVVRIIVEEGPNFMSTIRTEAAGVSLEVTRGAFKPFVEAAVQETTRQMTRPRMPGAGR